MTKLETINAEDLQNRTYEPTPFLVDELIPEGLHILAGAPKIGKSWLALWLCLCISQGQPLWNFATTQGEVLYLSLEDSFQRIQLRKLHDDDPMNMISGSTGLSGAADSTFVLQKSSRLADIASLHCTGRDIPDRTLKLEFGEDDHVWKLLEDSKTCSGASRISTLRIENLLSELLQKESEISAPAKALLEKIDPVGSEGWTPNSFSHQIRKSVDALRRNGITVSFRKSNGDRLICLKRVDGVDDPAAGNIVTIDPENPPCFGV